jgi:hypothetical protein
MTFGIAFCQSNLSTNISQADTHKIRGISWKMRSAWKAKDDLELFNIINHLTHLCQRTEAFRKNWQKPIQLKFTRSNVISSSLGVSWSKMCNSAFCNISPYITTAIIIKNITNILKCIKQLVFLLPLHLCFLHQIFVKTTYRLYPARWSG